MRPPDYHAQPAQWKEKIKVLYEPLELSESRVFALRTALRNAPEPKLVRSNNAAYLAQATKKLTTLHRSGIGYFVTAISAAALTLAVVNWNDTEADALDEVLTAGSTYPPDFDLEGDASSLHEVMRDLLPKEVFNPQIPLVVKQNYFPADGRFFTWRGESGVRITLKQPSVKGKRKRAGDALFIVRLNDRNTKKFPAKKVTKRIANQTGREKTVQTWREGHYGYALVQYVATNDEPPNSNESTQ
jgi:hypothetical protein